MALSLIATGSGVNSGSSTLSFSVGGVGDTPTLAVIMVGHYSNNTTSISSVTFDGQSCSLQATDTGSITSIFPTREQFVSAIFHILSPATVGAATVTITLSNSTVARLSGTCQTMSGGGLLLSTATSSCSDPTCNSGSGGSGGTTTGNLNSIVGGFQFDSLVEGVQTITNGTGQTQLFGFTGPLGIGSIMRHTRKSGQATPNNMSYSWNVNAVFSHSSASYGFVTFEGFDGVQYTAEGTNRPEEPGFPGAPAFPSYGSAPSASPYESLKKGIQVESLLNNAKFI